MIDIREFFKPLARRRRIAGAAPLSGSSGQRLQRVQIGLFGLCCMILLIALADIVTRRAQQTEATVVPVIAPPANQTEAPPRRDPLAEAGVVPGMPNAAEVPTVPGPPQEARDAPPARQPSQE